MKKIAILLVFGMAMFLALNAPASAQTTTKKVCYYRCYNVKRVVRQGCNSCARLLVVEQNMAILMAKKSEDRHPGDHDLLMKFQKEFDDLLPRVAKLEADMLQAQGDITELRTNLNNTNLKVDDHEIRIVKLEGQCYVRAGRNAKGKKAFFDSCTGEEIEPDGKGGWSVKKTVIVVAATGGGAVVVWKVVKWWLKHRKGSGLNGGATGLPF